MKPLYEATATAEGGRDGHVRSPNGRIDLKTATPREMGGPDGGTNPEELFAAGYSACFLSAMIFVGRPKHLDLADATVEGHVAIGPNDKGPGFTLAVRHVVRTPKLAQAEAEALVAEAHTVCPYSNATRGNIEVDFEVHGA